jgi:hypothetical protein
MLRKLLRVVCMTLAMLALVMAGLLLVVAARSNRSSNFDGIDLLVGRRFITAYASDKGISLLAVKDWPDPAARSRVYVGSARGFATGYIISFDREDKEWAFAGFKGWRGPMRIWPHSEDQWRDADPAPGHRAGRQVPQDEPTYGYWRIDDVPFRWPVAALAIPSLSYLTFVAAAVVRIHRRRRHGQCLQCGYDLRGSAGACPECGRAR